MGNQLSGSHATFIDKLRQCLVDPQERIINLLGNSFAQTFFATGTIGNGFAILSDRRLYFKGKCFIRKGKGFYRKLEERSVDLADVTGVGFVHNKAIWAKVLAIIFTVYATMVSVGFILNLVIELLNGSKMDMPAEMRGSMIVIVLIMWGLAWLFWFLHKMYNYSLFEISYAGGGIAFDLNWISKEEAEVFQKNIQQAKAEVKNQELKNLQTVLASAASRTADLSLSAAASTPGQADIATELKKYKELLDTGILTQEEFNKLKQDLLR